MKKYLLLAILLLVGCATIPTHDTTRFEEVEVSYLGIRGLNVPDEGIKVIYIGTESPASKGGLIFGDVITYFNNVRVKSYNQIVPLIRNTSSEIPVMVKIIRAGKHMQKMIKLEKHMIPRDTVVGDAISYLIAEGNDIRLIVLGEATIISPQDPSFDSNKKNAEKIFIDKRLTEAESDLLKGFAPMKNFSLVDRRNIKELLAEWEIGLSGLTSEFRENLHKLYGATHLFVISSQIVMSYKGATEQQITKLIDVRSGKILAVSTRIIKTKF